MAGASVASLAWALVEASAGLAAKSNGAGFILSPVSLYFALGLALQGSGGSSRQEMYHLLHRDAGRLLGLLPPADASDADVRALLQAMAALSAGLAGAAGQGCELLLANGVWTNKVAILPTYADAARQLFQAEARQAASVEPINAWAAEQTKGLIKTVLPPGTPFDVVLTNAVYFKGLWEFAFRKEATYDAPFQLEANGGSVQVRMMHRSLKPSERGSSPERRALLADAPAYKAVRLPYKGTSVSAVFVLPSEQLAAGGVTRALAQLDVADLVARDKFKPLGPAGLELHLPRFTVKAEAVSLKQPLQQMGLRAAFDPSLTDFSGLSPEPLFISDVLQSVCVIVDEEGTEAAAVTAVTMMRCAAVIQEPPVLRFDRPFGFLLVDDASGTPLFAGSVSDPSKPA